MGNSENNENIEFVILQIWYYRKCWMNGYCLDIILCLLFYNTFYFASLCRSASLCSNYILQNMVHATFFLLFFSLIIAWNGFWQFFFFFSIFWLKPPDFCLVVRWVYPPYPLSGPTTKKTLLFMCVFHMREIYFMNFPFD